jgi:hypothetical protein
MFPMEVFSNTFTEIIINQGETLYTSFSCNIVNSDLLVAAQPFKSAVIVLRTCFFVAGLPGLGVAH